MRLFTLIILTLILQTFSFTSVIATEPRGGNTDLSQPRGDNIGSSALENPLGEGSTLSTFIANILDVVVYVGGFVIIFMIVYVGFLFVVAQGKEAKIAEARQALLWTIIGGLILLGAKGISLGIQATVQALSTP